MTRRLKQRLVLAFQIGFVLLLILGMIVGRILVKRSQDNRQQASGNCVGFFQIPNVASLSAKINDTSIDLCPLEEGTFHLVSKATKTSGAVSDTSLSDQTTSLKTEGQIFTHIFQCQQANVTEITLTVERTGSSGVWTHVHTCTASSATPAPTPTLSPTPSPTPAAPQVCTNTNADIVFIIDRSDSMNDLESGKKKIDWVKEATQNVVNTYGTKSSGKIRFGVVVFGMKGVASSSTDIYAARTLSGLSNNYSQINQTISGITGTDSGTCIECGLRLANTELEKAPTGTARVAILLSDGGATYTWDREQDRPKAIANAYASADYGRSKGIRYVTARYGNSSVGDAVMSTIAGSTGFYSYKPTTQEWSTALAGLGEQICKAAPNIATQTQATTAPTVAPTATPTPTISAVTRTTVTTPRPTTQTLALAVATATPTPTPVPTPVPTAVPACTSACTTSAQCPSSMICSGGSCRNPSCVSSLTCVCPTATPSPTPVILALAQATATPVPTPTPTPVPQCNSSCESSSTCPSGMSCYLGICRTTACQSSSNCVCATPTPIATATPVTIAQTSTSTTTQTTSSSTSTSSTTLDPSNAPVSGSTTQTVVLLLAGIVLLFGGFLFIFH